MGCSTITAVLLTVGVFLLLQHQSSICVFANPASSEMMTSSNDLANANNRGPTGRRRSSLPVILSQSRPLSKQQVIRARLTPLEPLISDLLIDDNDDLMDIGKRQSDDYGHMRFGKRGEVDDKFDDYGHMRFGRDHI